MFKKIQRNIDQKFLLSLDENIWVDNINESKMFNIDEFKNIMSLLLNTYQENDLKDKVEDARELTERSNKTEQNKNNLCWRIFKADIIRAKTVVLLSHV